ncbi:MAG: ABC transporter ATP-binding protein [Dehalococcoidia bacterium]|nr:ABC transporter ATP-binding protein [Dehalococcoidia bacterium]MDH4291219.1 ABC transporter ATP-binding protein [Dehalococcoidia bacterium]
MLEIKNVSKIYGQGTAKVVALSNVSFRVDEGDFIAIMGPSGSGKSTLLNVIGGLDYPSSGEVILDGKRIDNLDENDFVGIRRNKIAYVFQQYHLLPSLTALENVMLPLIFCGLEKEEESALDMLEEVGLGGRTEHKPSQLSGGEQQRVAIARALVNSPSLILADEPTGNMDQETGREILGLFQQLNKDGRSIVMVTHNPDIARHAKEIIILQDGRIINKIDQKGGNRKDVKEDSTRFSINCDNTKHSVV